MENSTPAQSSSQEAAPGTRERLIAAMLHALKRKGYHGVGLAELLEHASAPKGVLYHHFPGGKAALAVAAIETVTSQMTAGLERLMQRSASPLDALSTWMAAGQKLLATSSFETGCPLATVALESGANDMAIRQALARAFEALRTALASSLRNAGIAADDARNLAALIVSAYEGALLQSRVAGSVDTMSHTSDALLQLVRFYLSKVSPAETA